MLERFRTNNRIGIKKEIQTGFASTYPEIHTLSTRARRDGNGSKPHEVYHHIIHDEAEVLFRDEAVDLLDGNRLVIATRIPASTHTTETTPDGQPAHIIHWMMRQDRNGIYSPIPYLELARLPKDQRDLVLKAYSARLLHGHAEFAQKLTPVGLESMLYATVGYHAKEAREQDGHSRGAQSNPTIHFMDNVLPRAEKSISATDLTPNELLKQIDPLSSRAFEVSKRPIVNFLSTIVKESSVAQKAKVTHFSESDKEAFPHGWKVSFGKDGADVADGLAIFLNFYDKMQTLWDTAKKFRKSPKDKALQTAISSIIGTSGVDFLNRLKPIKGELSAGEFADVKKSVEARWATVAKDSNDNNQKLLATLMVDMVADMPQFTMPGVPSFNVAFDFSADGKIGSLLIIPALSEKGVIERLRGIVRREEGGATTKPQRRYVPAA